MKISEVLGDFDVQTLHEEDDGVRSFSRTWIMDSIKCVVRYGTPWVDHEFTDGTTVREYFTDAGWLHFTVPAQGDFKTTPFDERGDKLSSMLDKKDGMLTYHSHESGDGHGVVHIQFMLRDNVTEEDAFKHAFRIQSKLLELCKAEGAKKDGCEKFSWWGSNPEDWSLANRLKSTRETRENDMGD